MNKFANPETKWKNLADKLDQSIRSGKNVPEDEINDFMKLTRRLFDGTPYLQPAEDRAFELHRKWKSCLLKNNQKRKRKEMEKMNPVEDIMDDPLNKKIKLSPVLAQSIRDSIKKIAINNNISMADKVTIKLSSDNGLVTFKGIEDTREETNEDK